MDENAVLIGRGTLSWLAEERRSDRYGSVIIIDRDADGKPMHTEIFLDIDKIRSMEGQKGKLLVEILGTRQSVHMGDLFRGLRPSTPTVGQLVVLGDGNLFWSISEGFMCIGLSPEDGRDSDWLNPVALYQVHEQTVNLYFIPS